ncbi:MAG: SDR family oxidoreductase [Comamonas sp.]
MNAQAAPQGAGQLAAGAPAVLVTGAASGIGAAVARRLAAQGRALLIHTGRNQQGAEAVAAECRALGAPRVRVLLGDLADSGTVDRLLAAADALGPLRGVVASAGYADRTALAELTPAAMERAWQTMVLSLSRLLQASLPRLAQPATGLAAGRFVAVSSFVAHRYTAAASAFPATAAAKAAVEALVKAAAVEAAASGVTVNAVAPGYVQKDRPGQGALNADQWRQAASQIPLGRLAQPDDIAGPVCFLLADEARYITGQVLHVNGGLTL